ncbi:helix-turn-helix domain-containing protein [Deinococcus hopiensis]|nr:helix-turn-helix domain-containing protein [Deinococcus hopiensis]
MPSSISKMEDNAQERWRATQPGQRNVVDVHVANIRAKFWDAEAHGTI